MFGEYFTYLFPGGRALKLIKNSVNITNSTNPFQITKNITLTVLDCCAPPPVRLAAHCRGAGALIAASIASPNPVTIGSAVHLISRFMITVDINNPYITNYFKKNIGLLKKEDLYLAPIIS